VTCSPIASLMKLEKYRRFYFVVRKHKFTFDTFKGYSYILWDYL
jgi:hypothetical protein